MNSSWDNQSAVDILLFRLANALESVHDFDLSSYSFGIKLVPWDYVYPIVKVKKVNFQP